MEQSVKILRSSSNQFQQFNENNKSKKRQVSQKKKKKTLMTHTVVLCPDDVGKCRPKQKSQTCYNFHEKLIWEPPSR